ncbi:hypothetical protein AZE42_04498 [Rhizopogon vesiculosus]|uniref:Small nuclear ribonucleoprotein Prp3 C-terminal domain-containing protein n=1 Tax=Rhizopogon vesiculosus TaxID=180088 RepID=A0A1J8QC98_9AGAM|nr:hypothetical protein AZE42_04498 [Rhizopogon vesiculosus]
MCLQRQLQELQLIQHSLLPGESFSFTLPPEDSRIWHSLLDSFSSTDATSTSTSVIIPTSIPRAKFEVRASDAQLRFEIDFPERYPDDTDIDDAQAPSVSVNGEDISREKHYKWRAFIQQTLSEVQGNDFPIYQLLCMHLLPKIHEELSGSMDSPDEQDSRRPLETAYYHALLTSHHLVSPAKRRSLQRWSSELSICGFAKVGYPGVIYAQGAQENVEEFVSNVKSMQWLALKVRFVEPIDLGSDEHHQSWTEFQKVGEVVEEMKRWGKDRYITEMGIGSLGLK